jgi:hypothetical protein
MSHVIPTLAFELMKSQSTCCNLNFPRDPNNVKRILVDSEQQHTQPPRVLNLHLAERLKGLKHEAKHTSNDK